MNEPIIIYMVVILSVIVLSFGLYWVNKAEQNEKKEEPKTEEKKEVKEEKKEKKKPKEKKHKLIVAGSMVIVAVVGTLFLKYLEHKEEKKQGETAPF